MGIERQADTGGVNALPGPMFRRNILIFHQAALGDFVVTLPLAVAIGRSFPQSRVIYVTAAGKGALARELAGVEAVDAEAGWHTLYSADPKLPDASERLLTGATKVIAIGSPGEQWERSVRRVAFDPELIVLRPDAQTPHVDGFPPEYRGHVLERLVGQLANTQVPQTAAVEVARSVCGRGLGRRRGPGKGVLIHPGSGSEKKNWPLDRYLTVAESLSADGIDVRFVIGEAELERWTDSQRAALEQAGPLVAPADYLGLLKEIAASAAFVGNDSGPGHLAGITATPTVCLFGGSPALWKPLGPNVSVVQADTIDQVKPQTVLAAIGQAMGRG